MLTYYFEQLDAAVRDRLRLKDIAAHVAAAIMRLRDPSPADFGVHEDGNELSAGAGRRVAQATAPC